MNIVLNAEKTKEKMDSSKRLDILLKNKKEEFIENIFSNYSHTEKSNYIEKNNLKAREISIYDTTVFIMAIGSFSAALRSLLELSGSTHFSLHLINGFLFFMLGAFFALLHKMTFFQKFTSNKWLKKEKNKIKLASEMFSDYIIDKEVMKAFTECYGEEALVDLMFKKQNLKYRDILLYMNKERKTTDDNNEKIRLRNAVKCLVEQE